MWRAGCQSGSTWRDGVRPSMDHRRQKYPSCNRQTDLCRLAAYLYQYIFVTINSYQKELLGWGMLAGGEEREIGHEPFVPLDRVFGPACRLILDDHENSRIAGLEDAQAAP